MSSSRNKPDDIFPNAHSKLQNAPRKTTAFEKQKAEAEAKRRREAAETAAVFEDFVKSFDHDERGADPSRQQHGAPSRGGPLGGGAGGRYQDTKRTGLGVGGAASKRHFVQSGTALKSGPGSLGPPPTAFGKKRAFDAFQRDGKSWDRGAGDGDRGLLGFEEHEGPAPAKAVARAFHASDDEEEAQGSSKEEDMVSRPTLQLAQLPPRTSPAAVRALIPPSLSVEGVKILQGAPRAGTERRAAVAIVTLSQDTPANEMDAVVSQLQNRYLGFGHHLSIHRHLSSAVATSTATAMMNTTSSSAQPFGAKPVAQSEPPRHGGFHRGFAPPTSYGPPSAVHRGTLMHVPVKPPQDVRTVKMINMVIEGLLEHGPEFEALLMTRPDVQREEKWAWIWDARSEGAVWYRWKLWQVVTGSGSSSARGAKERYHPIFEDSHAWKEPTKGLPFEYAVELDELVSDPDYDSSDDEEWEDAQRDGAREGDEKTFLNPLEKARLAHLLSRLPTTLSRIRKGDIARVTAFAITHASRGADEVVDMIVSNIDRPFALTGANPERSHKSKAAKNSSLGPGSDEQEGTSSGNNNNNNNNNKSTTGETSDLSGANLVGLYAVSDILSSSSTSTVRHAWRFRQLFEVALQESKTFEKLGMLPHKHGWGRLRADKWKRSVGLVLNLWEGWCVFPAGSQEVFVRSFEEPPALKAAREKEQAGAAEAKKGRWKAVEGQGSGAEQQVREDSAGSLPLKEEVHKVDDVEGEPMEEDDVHGEPMDDDIQGEPMGDEDAEGEPMADDVEGEPMEEDDAEGEAMDESDADDKAAKGETQTGTEAGAPKELAGTVGSFKFASKPAGQPRSRMRAADMFEGPDGGG